MCRPGTDLNIPTHTVNLLNVSIEEFPGLYLCRFFMLSIEDPPHVLFECEAKYEVAVLGNEFTGMILANLPQLGKYYSDSWELFRTLLADKKVTNLLAKVCL